MRAQVMISAGDTARSVLRQLRANVLREAPDRPPRLRKNSARAQVLFSCSVKPILRLSAASRRRPNRLVPDVQRFQKELIRYKNQALKQEDRVIVIGSWTDPEKPRQWSSCRR